MSRKKIACVSALVIALVFGVYITATMAVTIGGTGFLYAKGKGTALLQGSGRLLLRGKGVITIEDYGESDLVVKVEGHGSKVVRGNSVIYSGCGKISVKGSDLLIHIRTLSDDSEAIAYGTGWVVLQGTGVFKTWKS